MRFFANVIAFSAALLLQGCANLFGPPPMPGDTIEMVIEKLGPPKGVYPDPDAGQVFEYPQGPFGQTTFMARFGADRRLRSYEQVLTNEKFGQLKIDRATKEDVLRTIGRPAEQSRVALRDYEVWSYRYKESGVWNSMMHVHFDRDGIVRLMQNGPDPMYDDKRFFR
jgi:hypothetical protein